MAKKVIEMDGDAVSNRKMTSEQITILYEHRSEVAGAGRALDAARLKAKEARQDYDQAIDDMMTYVDELRSGQTRLPLKDREPEDEEAEA